MWGLGFGVWGLGFRDLGFAGREGQGESPLRQGFGFITLPDGSDLFMHIKAPSSKPFSGLGFRV